MFVSTLDHIEARAGPFMLIYWNNIHIQNDFGLVSKRFKLKVVKLLPGSAVAKWLDTKEQHGIYNCNKHHLRQKQRLGDASFLLF